MKRVRATVCLFVLSSAAFAQQIPNRATLDGLLGADQILEDFETFNVANNTPMNLTVYVLDSTTVANGQGPGLVEPGVTYIDPSSDKLQWNGDGYFQLATKTLLANGDQGRIDITYQPPVQAMGVDVANYEGFGFSGTATVFDTSGSAVGSVAFTLDGSAGQRVFVGWLHTMGIGRVSVHSPDYFWSPLIDDHGYGGDVEIGVNYCPPAIPNSTGVPGTITATGSVEVSVNDVTLTADQLPMDFGYFLASPTQGFFNPPGSIGFICLSGSIGRYNQPGNIGQGPSISIQVDLTAVPQPTGPVAVQPGDTWNFQCWYRDLGSTNNFTDGVSITFQ